MATATQERTTLPAGADPDARARLSTPIQDMQEDLVRFNSALDYLEAHGDDDTFGVVSLMRPFATSLGNRLGDLRAAAHG